MGRGGYSPLELEQKFGMTNGDLGHGTYRWIQQLSFRPVVGWSKYRTPIAGLYMAGQATWSPLDGGLLGGALEKLETGRRKGDNFEKDVAKHREKLEKYENLCREIGNLPGEVALAWLLHNPIVTASIIGPRTMEQLESAVRATEIVLDEDTLQKLDQIFPGP